MAPITGYGRHFAGGTPQYATPEQMAQALRNAGFAESMIPTMVAIGMAESGGAINVYNDYGAWHHGPWQISGLHTGRQQQENPQLYDLQANANMAKQIYDRQGLGAWESYTEGTHQQFLPGGRGMNDYSTPPTPGAPTPQGGGNDSLMAQITAIMKQVTDPKTDYATAMMAQQRLETLITIYKWQNPYTPIELALKQWEINNSQTARNDARADAQYDRDLGRYTAGQNAEERNFQNSLLIDDRQQQNQRDAFGLGRQFNTDKQNLADAEYANMLLHFDRKVGESDRELQSGIAHVNRAVGGKNIGTERANYITDTQLAAAPMMRPYGADYRPFMEPGGPVAGLFEKLGLGYNPDAGFKYAPGTENQGFVTIDPRGELAAQDTALGVGGPIPGLPQFTPHDIPAPPDYQALGISASDPTDIISQLQNHQFPTPPQHSMSGYPQHGGYSPMSPPPNLQSILGSGGFNVNGIGDPRGTSPSGSPLLQGISTPQEGTIFAPGAGNYDPFMSHEFSPATSSILRPPPSQPKPGGGFNLGSIDPMAVVNFLTNPSQAGYNATKDIQMPQVDPMSILRGLDPRNDPAIQGLVNFAKPQSAGGMGADPLALLAGLFGRR